MEEIIGTEEQVIEKQQYDIGVKSPFLDTNGKRIFSGQKVTFWTRTTTNGIGYVRFEPGYGFEFIKNKSTVNFADAHDVKIIEDISFLTKLKAGFKLFIDNITG